MAPFASRFAVIGIVATAAALASCGNQEQENANAPGGMESMSDGSSGSRQDSMKDMPMPESAPTGSTETQTHMTKGTIQSVDREAGTIKIAHEAVPSLNWPAMTMDFKVPNKEDLAGLKEGDLVEFQFAEESAGRYAITAISQQR
jgi:Cu/Ag efflux protein CusF